MRPDSLRLLAVAVVASAASGCCPWFGNACPPQAAGVGWDVSTKRDLRYQLNTTTGFSGTPASLLQEVELSFQGGGAVQVTIDGQVRGTFQMTPGGDLQKGPGVPPVETDYFTLLDQGQPATVGASWNLLQPADAEVAQMQDRVVFQSRLACAVTASSAQALTLDEQAFVRLGDTPAARTFFDQQLGPAAPALVKAMTPLLDWRLYLTGTAEFDRQAGQLKKLVARRSLHASAGNTAAQLAADPQREEITLVLR